MAKLNDNYAQLQGMYLFSEIAQRVAKYKADNPSANVISMGIGDVSQPLVPSVISALQKATLEMGTKEGFRGYGPEQGYDFLREAIAKNDYADRNLAISADEIFISDGSKCDVGNFQELFHADARIAISDPVYPVYVDSQIMAGRSGNFDGSLWDNIYYIPCSIENNFIPELPKTPVDVIYLCYPNNPTGTVLSRAELKKWVDYAKKEQAIILFDAAYEAYITDSDIPRSIYEIEGASDVAIEFKSFSKTAGFTGLRCAYTVVPKNVFGTYSNGEKKDLHSLWKRRQSTKYNGCPYIVQRAAEALYTPEAKVEIENILSIYKNNARVIFDTMQAKGLQVVGGENSPYVWVKTPANYGSWEFFSLLLEKTNIVCTPGVGFGLMGEGYIRFSAFASTENTLKAMESFKNLIL